MIRKLRLAWLVFLPFILWGCGTEPVHKPAELKPIKNPQISVTEAWKRGLGDGTNGLFSELRPLIHGKTLYAADANGNVWAFKRKNGDTVWKHATHIGLLSGPARVGNLIVVGGLNGQVVALDARTGKKRWQTELSSEVLSTPGGANGVIVVRCVNGIVYGLAASDGTRRWSFERNQPRLTVRGTSSPVVANGDVIIGLDNGKVVSLSLDTGEVEWQTTLAVPSGASELEQLVDVDGHLGRKYGAIYAASYGGQLASMDIYTGRVNWRDSLSSYSGVTLGRSTLFVSDAADTLYSLNSLDGSHNWKNSQLSYRGLTRPVLQKDYLVVADREGYLHWLTRAGGKLVGRYRVEDVGLTAAPVVSGRYLYVEADNGRLTALKIQSVHAAGGDEKTKQSDDHSDQSTSKDQSATGSTLGDGLTVPGLNAPRDTGASLGGAP